MAQLLQTIPFIFMGLFIVTLIDSVGSIASRKFNFNYGYLSPLSFATYTLIGYLVSGRTNLICAFIAVIVVGIYDATVGWDISLKLNANLGSLKDESLEMNIYS